MFFSKLGAWMVYSYTPPFFSLTHNEVMDEATGDAEFDLQQHFQLDRWLCILP